MFFTYFGRMVHVYNGRVAELQKKITVLESDMKSK